MASMLTHADVSRTRMASLLLHPAAATSRPTLDVVRHFLAIQAQDAPGAAYAIGLRTGATEAATMADLDSREIVRTWPMRGTLHLVPSRDARWMLGLMGVKALAAAANRRKQLGLEEHVANRGAAVLTAAVAASDEPLPRSACLAALAEAGIPPAGQVGYHLLWFTAQQGLIAGGPPRGKEQTFVVLDDWAPAHHEPDREHALAMIAAAYVRGHGPVDDRELARWTGLGLGDARAGLRAAADAGDIVEVETPAGSAWATQDALETAATFTHAPTRLLPGFDEFMLGLSESARAVDPRHHEAIVPGGNGVFKATIVDRGRVVGIWERTVLAASHRLELRPFAALAETAARRVAKAADAYAAYAGVPVQLRWASARA